MNSQISGPVIVTGNTGDTQVAANSPGSIQTINHKRVLKNEVGLEKFRRDNVFVLRITIQQTEGIWDAGSTFSLQVYLTGAYLRYRFLTGYVPTMPLVNVTTTDGNAAAAAKGIFELTTMTPPRDEPIILEFESMHEVDVDHILAQPRDSERSPTK
jgi:hypothetical protein